MEVDGNGDGNGSDDIQLYKQLGMGKCALGEWVLRQEGDPELVEAILIPRPECKLYAQQKVIVQFKWPREVIPVQYSFSSAVKGLAVMCGNEHLPLCESLLMDAIAPFLLHRNCHNDGVWKDFALPGGFTLR